MIKSNTRNAEYEKENFNRSKYQKMIYSIYLNVLMVAILFSTVSGVLPGSCDPSLGAIFFARILTT